MPPPDVPSNADRCLAGYLHGISNREAEDGASYLSFAVMTQASGKSFLAEGGQLGHLIDEFDWSKTPAGAHRKMANRS